MKTYSGPFLTEEGFIQAEITVDSVGDETEKRDQKIVDFQEGGDSGYEAIIIPTLFNSHVHTGDSIVKNPPIGNIAELVGPGGYKHRVLESAAEDELMHAMKNYLEELVRFGIRDMIDFREGGVKGIEMIRAAADELEDALNLNIFARPSGLTYDRAESNEILSIADGIGISSFRDWNKTDLTLVAEAADKSDIPFALHCSEDVREPIEEVLELNVHHLVHMLEATSEDFEICAEENIPVVVCPRANRFFGKTPDIPAMLKEGLTVCLGTDNAMLASPNMFREMEAAYSISASQGGVEPLDILMMGAWNPRKVLYPSSFISKQSINHYLILEKGKGNREPAYEVVTKISTKDILEVVEW